MSHEEYLLAKIEDLEQSNINLLRQRDALILQQKRLEEENKNIRMNMDIDRVLMAKLRKNRKHLAKKMRKLVHDHQALKEYINTGFTNLKVQLEDVRDLSLKREKIINEVLKVMYENKQEIWGSTEVINFVEDTARSVIRGTFPEE